MPERECGGGDGEALARLDNWWCWVATDVHNDGGCDCCLSGAACSDRLGDGGLSWAVATCRRLRATARLAIATRLAIASWLAAVTRGSIVTWLATGGSLACRSRCWVYQRLSRRANGGDVRSGEVGGVPALPIRCRQCAAWDESRNGLGDDVGLGCCDCSRSRDGSGDWRRHMTSASGVRVGLGRFSSRIPSASGVGMVRF